MGELNTEKGVELCGTIDKVIYKGAESGFSVFSVKVSKTESVIAKGCLPDLFQGEVVSLKGVWGFHPKFGRQFDVKEFVSKVPSSVAGIQKYLSSGLIKGIGPKFAERLVERFGEATLEIIEKTPSRLKEVGGIGDGRIALITQAWQDQKEISKVMVFLRAKDVGTSFAVKIFKTYGVRSIELIQENPYRLVDDIWGIGFKSADQIALKLGLEPNSLARVKAGFIYSITDATSNGHLYLDVQQAKEQVIKLLELDAQSVDLLKRALHELYRESKIKLISHEDHHYLSLPQYYYSEKGIANKILKLLNRDSDGDRIDSDKVYQMIRLPDQRGVELNEDQQRGILACVQNRVAIITGGPGTGKTTLIKRLLEVLESDKMRFRLAAPTGRAAKRMFEGTGKNSETLHRLLEFTPAIMNFSRNEQNALDLDFLIVDESSMIDVFLMHALLKALPEKAHLILIGDVDQIPSVGAGNVLNDLIASEKISVIRLNHIFRQAQDSLIIVNAHRVNRGEFPTSVQEGSRRDFAYLKEDVPENIFPLLRELFTKKLPAKGINLENTVVLVPMNRGTVGTQRINQELQMILNPAENLEKQIARFGQVYKINDRVMQIRNNYDKFVFNGDIGKVTDIDLPNQKMVVIYGDRELEYDFAELDELTLAYALSIHKSQGSEFDAVIIPLFMQHFVLLQRNLIYTAITRAKKLCIIIGQAKAIAMGIKNNKGVARTTFLKQFLTSDLEAR